MTSALSTKPNFVTTGLFLKQGQASGNLDKEGLLYSAGQVPLFPHLSPALSCGS